MDISKGKSNNTYTASGWFIDQAFRDPEFQKELIESVLGEAKPLDYFMDKYLIPNHVISNLSVEDEGHPGGVGVFNIYDEDLAIVVRFSKNVTKREYLNAWKLVQWYKDRRLYMTQPKSKRKSPQYPELLYAIYKARNKIKPLTFRQIFSKYQNDNLPYYTKKVKPFTDEDSLERYYQKYRPRPPVT